MGEVPGTEDVPLELGSGNPAEAVDGKDAEGKGSEAGRVGRPVEPFDGRETGGKVSEAGRDGRPDSPVGETDAGGRVSEAGTVGRTEDPFNGRDAEGRVSEADRDGRPDAPLDGRDAGGRVPEAGRVDSPGTVPFAPKIGLPRVPVSMVRAGVGVVRAVAFPSDGEGRPTEGPLGRGGAVTEGDGMFVSDSYTVSVLMPLKLVWVACER